jgi:hypothetical protein
MCQPGLRGLVDGTVELDHVRARVAAYGAGGEHARPSGEMHGQLLALRLCAGDAGQCKDDHDAPHGADFTAPRQLQTSAVIEPAESNS